VRRPPSQPAARTTLTASASKPVVRSPGIPRSRRVQLQDVKGTNDSPYCALSYSWGQGHQYLLTSHNIDEFQKEIYVSNLPKTFRDAVKVARGVGYRYLWADALCIVQDGPDSPLADQDWMDQTGKTSDTFGNAVVTISASLAHDGGQGFINQRNPLCYTTCRLDLEIGDRTCH
jgi:hypothetical protein